MWVEEIPTETREQENAFLIIIKDEDVLFCFVMSRVGGRVNFPWSDHCPGLFPLVSGPGSALTVRHRRSPQLIVGIVSMLELEDIEEKTTPYKRATRFQCSFDHFQLNSGVIEELGVHWVSEQFYWCISFGTIDQNRGCCEATKRPSMNLCERVIAAGPIINSISIALLFIINMVCCRGLNWDSGYNGRVQ